MNAKRPACFDVTNGFNQRLSNTADKYPTIKNLNETMMVV